jgi:hypothetical protein
MIKCEKQQQKIICFCNIPSTLKFYVIFDNNDIGVATFEETDTPISKVSTHRCRINCIILSHNQKLIAIGDD